MGDVVRTLCLWWPDWPVVVARRAHAELIDVPVAIFEFGVVLAASEEARREGVKRGQRRRDAQARCPEIVVLDVNQAADAVAFESVARSLEAITPRLALERPGVLSFPTRGPSRYFGGDEALAARVIEVVGATARVGIADGPFAARLAAQSVEQSRVIASEETTRFLASWSISVLNRPDLADLLTRLGLRTLGAFATLPPSAVLARFGADGLAAHRLASGLDEQPADLRVPPADLVEVAELDPPAARVDIAMFAGKTLADQLLGRLAERGLVCTRVLVEAETEHGERVARSWRHDGALTPHALAERVRWQLDAWLTTTAPILVDDVTGDVIDASDAAASGDLPTDEATGGLTLLRLVPEEVLPASGRQLGFWGGDPAAADRATRAFARVQGMLGHAAVTTAVEQGGRTPGERVAWVPWGEPRDPRDVAAGGVGAPTGTTMRRQPQGQSKRGQEPWPGAIPAPAPALVFEPPIVAALLDATGTGVRVSGRGVASAPPAWLRCGQLPNGGGPVVAWAGPWVHDVRWWDPTAHRRRALWQVVIDADRDSHVACLVALERGRAVVEAIYD